MPLIAQKIGRLTRTGVNVGWEPSYPNLQKSSKNGPKILSEDLCCNAIAVRLHVWTQGVKMHTLGHPLSYQLAVCLRLLMNAHVLRAAAKLLRCLWVLLDLRNIFLLRLRACAAGFLPRAWCNFINWRLANIFTLDGNVGLINLCLSALNNLPLAPHAMSQTLAGRS